MPAFGSSNELLLVLTIPPALGPFWGKLTPTPGATVAALSGGIRAKNSAY